MAALRFCLGLAFLPLCVSVSRTVLGLVFRPYSPAEAMTASALPAVALGGGILAWLLIFFLLPRFVRTYVLAHELTHALWGTLLGADVSAIKVSAGGGYVKLSKSNLFIALAPYFFPLYTVLAILAYYALCLFFDLRRWELPWLALVGFTWSFHVTFTVDSLLRGQSDIRPHGRLFSLTFIYLINLLEVGLWIVMVSTPTLEHYLRALGADALAQGQAVWALGLRLRQLFAG